MLAFRVYPFRTHASGLSRLYDFYKVSAQKTFFWSLNNCFFAKPSFSEFHQSSVEKNNFLEPEKLFFFCKAMLV